ncbi:MAG: RDD family protein [Bacteroidia bacterium]|nr:RDD family protein [Bacteroidia bacterium]
MRRIKINTAQNVVIEYEIALVMERIAAFLIDSLILSAFIFIISLSAFFIVPDFGNTVLYYLILMPVLLFYTLTSEILFNGQTLGKRAMDIKVVKLNGVEPIVSDYILRWAFRVVDIYFSLGLVAFVLVKSTHRAQRLGDIVAETTLVKIRPSKRYTLDNLNRIDQIDQYNPLFPRSSKT